MGIFKDDLENFVKSGNDKDNNNISESNLINKINDKLNSDEDINLIPILTNQENSKINNHKQYKYSGLNNQGMTCYLNSLLQILFMTPEFRFNVLNWKYNQILHGKKEDCIPYQLKKLFAKLQLKKRSAEDTKDLTKSFQWGSADALYQHDIQELCRVLFEAIEISLNSDDKNYINEIFEGQSASVVHCQECNFESIRSDKFLDISIPIRNEFEKIYNNSLEMALSNYIKPEVLENENQYSCDICKRKVNANKFIKFEKLPKVLFLQFNRFEYNFITDSRVKITDKITFPMILNMNLFKSAESAKNQNIENTLPLLDKNFFDKKAESKINFNEEILKLEISSAFKNGKDVYELYSIVIHSGTANGGHYFAYIKSFEDDFWYNYNDSDVSKISEKEIENVFGDKSATGYVLLYRKICEENNIKIIENQIIEDELINEINEDIEKSLLEEKAWRDRMNLFTVKIYYDNLIKEIKFKKDDSVVKMKEIILKELLFDKFFKPNDFMIRSYLKNHDKKEEYIEYEDLVNIYNQYLFIIFFFDLKFFLKISHWKKIISIVIRCTLCNLKILMENFLNTIKIYSKEI